MLINKITVTECDFPQASSIASEADMADFQDSYVLSSFEKLAIIRGYFSQLWLFCRVKVSLVKYTVLF